IQGEPQKLLRIRSTAKMRRFSVLRAAFSLSQTYGGVKLLLPVLQKYYKA
ncbi:14983_t:CDS:2, partial [Funneliformis caledonium]